MNIQEKTSGRRVNEKVKKKMILYDQHFCHGVAEYFSDYN